MDDKQVLQEKEVKRNVYIQDLREILKKKEIKVDLNDAFLTKFLRSKLYDVKETAKVIETYLSNFKKYPEFFENVCFAEEAINNGFFELLPERNKTGETVGIMRVQNWNPDEITFASSVAATVYGYEMALMDEETQINGCIEIVDFHKISVRQMMHIGLKEIKLIASMSDGSLPVRWRKFFVVRNNYITEILYKMSKPFLSKEFKEYIRFIGYDFTELHENVPVEILPEEYGGKAEPRECSSFYRKLADFEPKLLDYWKPFKNM